MKWLVRWLINAAALYATAYLVKGITVTDTTSLLLAAILLGIVNAFIRPVLLVLTLPFNVMTLGLFTFVLNALLLWLTSSLVDGFIIEGFFAAFIGSIAVSIISSILSMMLR